MPEKRPTLADVARRAGLSSAAASMVLNNRPDTRLSADAVRRVRAAARELGYRPNVAARGLRIARTNTIGFISDDVSVTRFASGQIRGALRAAEEADHVLLVIETGADRAREERAVAAVLDRQVDGLIFGATRAREIELPDVPNGTRIVVLNATTPLVASSVRPDEYEGGRAAVRTLIDFGHREGIVLIGQNAAREGDAFRSVNVELRVRGIFAELADAGLRFDAEIALAQWTPDDAYLATKKHLGSRAVPPRCILALNDPMAFGVYRAIQEAGLRIPDDISVLSFDNDDLTDFLRPRLTTIALPYEAMGEAAVRLLLSGEDEEILVPMPLILRDSLKSAR